MEKTLLHSHTIWEDIVGYSRAVKVGNMVFVAGTTAMNESTLVGKDDVYLQTQFILQKIGRSLEQVGSCLEQVVQTRIYVVDLQQWEAVAKAHRKVFEHIRPACTMVEVKALAGNELLVEIEAVAVIG